MYVLGRKYVFGRYKNSFKSSPAARAKMSLSRAKNIFTPKNINSIVILYHAREIATVKLSSGCSQKALSTKSCNISDFFLIKQLFHSPLLDKRLL